MVTSSPIFHNINVATNLQLTQIFAFEAVDSGNCTNCSFERYCQTQRGARNLNYVVLSLDYVNNAASSFVINKEVQRPENKIII